MGMPKKLRSRIKEDFTQEDMEFLQGLLISPMFTNNNDKADAILYHFRDKGFIELAPATNRFALLKGKYVYKFALDSYGVNDNNNEFEMSPELQPYVTKTYECNGLVLIAEYVNLISKEEFLNFSEHIKEILRILADDYIFSDIGTITRNHTNWGFKDDDSLVILDYGYVFRKDPKIMHCKIDGGNLKYSANFDYLYCDKCGQKYSIGDILYRMRFKEEDFEEEESYRGQGPLVVEFAGINQPELDKYVNRVRD